MDNGLPPHSIEAEEAILGSLLLDSSRFPEIELSPTEFYIEKNGWIFEAIAQLCEANSPVDVITLSDKLGDRLDLIGGAAYIARLTEVVPTSINAAQYASIVRKTAHRRALLEASSVIAALAYNPGIPVGEAQTRAAALIFDVTQAKDGTGLRPMSALMGDYYDRVHDLYQRDEKDGPIGIPSGFIDLDKLLGGWQEGEFILVAARPSMGKTSLCLDLALNAALKGYKVGFFSLEMSNEQVIQRLVSKHGSVDGQALRFGQLSDAQWPFFVQAAGGLSEINLWIDDTPGLSPAQVSQQCRKMQARVGLDLIIVDYLQLMGGNDKDWYKKGRVAQFTEISQQLKGLAKVFHVPLIAASQLSRACEQRLDKRPILSDLRETGALEQDADVVIFLYRDDMYNKDSFVPNICEVAVAKNRSGSTGQVELFFKKALTKFVDVAPADPPELAL